MRNWSPMQWVVAIIVIAAAIAIMYVALPAMGIAIPGWFKDIAVIVFIAIVAIIAIGLLVKFFYSWGDGPPPSPPAGS